MFPPFAINNAAYIRLANPMFSADALLGASRSPDIQDLSVSKFGGRAIHAPAIPICSVFGSIKHILAMSIPGKVFEKTVRWDSIKMPTLHSRWTRTDKCLKDESINQAAETLPLFNQCHRKAVPGGTRAKNPLRGICQDRFCPNNSPVHGTSNEFFPVRPHSPMVRNFVTWKVWDWFKNFWGCGRILVSHGVALLNRVTSGSEPYSCDNRGAACFFIST